MDIKKVLDLNAEESEKLVTAGRLLGDISHMLEDKSIDYLSEDTNCLVIALAEVVEKVKNKDK